MDARPSRLPGAGDPGVSPLLTAREIETLGAYCRTHSRRETAIALGLSVAAVAKHLESARRKLGADDSWRACEVARDLGLLRAA